jgi:CheY-like chemotaxis protein
MIDRAQAESAIINVLINARDALSKKGGRIRIRTKNLRITDHRPHQGLEPGCYVQLTVEDNGKGMDAETRERIFEPFFTTKGLGEGTGMGMAMVHGFTEQSGAKVEVDSEEGKGTTIRMTFPSLPHEVEEDDNPTGTSTRVLVVEDNHFVRDTVVDYLRMHGFSIRHADSGPEALELIEGGYVPDIMFSDIIMPGSVDGIETARLVRAKHPQVHILLTSGWTKGQDEQQIEFDVVPKPYDLDKVLHQLQELAAIPKHPPHQG